MMKKLALLVAMLLLASNAFAFDLGGYEGPIKLHLTGWGVGREYAPAVTTSGWIAEDPANNWFTTGDAQGLPNANVNTGTPIPDATYFTADGVEDSWGVLRLDDVRTYGGEIKWISPASGAGNYVVGIYYGFEDIYVSNNVVEHSGGYVDLYELSLLSTPNASASDPDARTGAAAYPGFTGTSSQLLARFQAVSLNSLPDYVGLPSDVTRQDTITSGLTNLPSNGSGIMVLDVMEGVGNSWQIFNGNVVYNDFNQVLTNHDLVMEYTFQYSPGVGTYSLTRFDSILSDPGRATAAIPEPTTMLLMGMGLAGVAALRKKRAA